MLLGAAAKQLGVGLLRDVEVADLPSALERLDDDLLRRRTRHVVTENDRVLRTVEILRAGRGGFGGSAIALVDADAIETVTSAVESAFAAKSFRTPQIFNPKSSRGVVREA